MATVGVKGLLVTLLCCSCSCERRWKISRSSGLWAQCL